MSKYAQYVVPQADTMLALGVGQPCPTYFNIMKYIETKDRPLELFQYGLCSGSIKYRTAVANMLTKYTGEKINPDNLYMTNGVSQAVFMLSALFRGSHVFVEDPTYFIMLKTFLDLGYRSHGIDLNNLPAFDTEVSSLFESSPDQRVIVYIVPFYQNPTGKTITDATILELVKICEKYPNLMILSDETYQMVSFASTQHKSLSMYHKNILSLGTFSKILAPACRLGWIHSTDSKIIHFLDETGFMDSGGSVNPVMGYDVAQLIGLQLYDDFFDYVKTDLMDKATLLYEAIRKYPDYFETNMPSGGYFLWVKSKQIPASKLLEIAKANKVSFHVGTKFSHKQNFGDYFRLSYSYYDRESLLCFEERLDNIVKDIKNFIEKENTVKVYLLGHSGKLGRLIKEECLSEKFTVVNIPKDCRFDLIPYGKHIVVDVSSPLGTKTLIEQLLKSKDDLPLIIGTTGDLPHDLIDEYKKCADVHVVPNFSIGVNMVDKMLQHVTPHYWTSSIYDLHHEMKKDAPSGTAKRFKRTIESTTDTDNVGIVSERIGQHVGHHEIILSSPFETVTITHTATDRKLFAKGCVVLIKKILEITY